jgi:hypothetical protein
MYGGTHENIYSLERLINYIEKEYKDQLGITQLLTITVNTSIQIDDTTDVSVRPYLIATAKKLSEIYDIQVDPSSWMGRQPTTDDSPPIPKECLEPSEQKKHYDKLQTQLREVYDKKKEEYETKHEEYNQYISALTKHNETKVKKFNTKPIEVDKPMEPILTPLNFCNISIKCRWNPNCDTITIPMKDIVNDYSTREVPGQTKDNNKFLQVKYYFESDPDKKLLTKYYISAR